MVERRNRFCFALHALFQFWRRREMRGQNFDRDRAIEASVAGAINFSHAARTEKRLNFVWTEFCARGERHASRNYIPTPRTCGGDTPVPCLDFTVASLPRKIGRDRGAERALVRFGLARRRARTPHA